MAYGAISIPCPVGRPDQDKSEHWREVVVLNGWRRPIAVVQLTSNETPLKENPAETGSAIGMKYRRGFLKGLTSLAERVATNDDGQYAIHRRAWSRAW